MTTATEIRPHHRVQLIKTLVLISFLLLLYSPVIMNLIRAWAIKPQSSHGYFILPIVLWLCWVRRRRFANLAVGGSNIGFFFLIPGLALYLLATVACVDTAANISMMLCLAGVIWTILGPDVIRAYLFPYVFLIFMFPIPDALYVSLTNPLKLFVSSVSANLIQILGISAYQDGNILHFANLKMEVVEACSGMRSIVTYLMLGTLLSSFLAGGLWRKGLLLFTTFPIALLNNILRITGTAILAHWYGQTVALGFFHEFAGLTIFGLGFCLMLGVYWLLSEKKSQT